MKVLVLLCAVSSALGGAAPVPWSAALLSPAVRTYVQPHSSTVAYSTTQYINALPAAYSFGLRPNFAYQVPHISGFAPLQSAYYQFPGVSYFPSNTLYPSLSPIAPQLPSFPSVPINYPSGAPPQIPAEQAPIEPENPSSDADTSVVDSAEYPQQEQSYSTEAPPSQPSFPQFQPPTNLPNFPGISQIADSPAFPQFPQGSFPNFPQLPAFPSNPAFPQGPSPAPSPLPPSSSFPGSDSGDRGLNDEDSVSVESA